MCKIRKYCLIKNGRKKEIEKLFEKNIRFYYL